MGGAISSRQTEQSKSLSKMEERSGCEEEEEEAACLLEAAATEAPSAEEFEEFF